MAINGLDVDELKAAFEPLHPGEPGWKDQFLPFFLESPEVLHAAGLGDNAETASVTLLEAGGAQNTLEFTAASDLPAPKGMGMYIADSHVIDAVRWGQPGTGELPLYLRDADSTFRAVELPEQDALFNAVRRGKPINSGYHMANSTMIAVMGQLACYSGKNTRWDKVVASDLAFGPPPEESNFDSKPPSLPDTSGNYPLPRPGLPMDFLGY